VSVRGSVRGPAGAAHYNGNPPRRRRRWWVRLLRAMTGIVIVGTALSLAAFGGLMLFTPSVGSAQQLAQAQAASRNVAYPGPPPPGKFTAALLATEDHRFYSEPGIDPFAVGKAVAGVVVHTGDPGGATLYQQLAKLLYTPGETSGVKVEAESVALAVKLRYTYTGPQILRMYSDVVYFGNGFWGLQAASCGYFGVQPAGLSWPQAAMLAGLVNGPTLDDPLTSAANGINRERHVIERLVADGVLTPAQAARARSVSLPVMLARHGQACAA
jgi:membrane carboxypeptidase/penicillin-binding protein